MLFTRAAYEDIGGHAAVKVVAARGCRPRAAASTRARDRPGCFSPTGSFIAACTASGRSSGAAGSASSCEAADRNARRPDAVGTAHALARHAPAAVDARRRSRRRRCSSRASRSIGWTLVALGLSGDSRLARHARAHHRCSPARRCGPRRFTSPARGSRRACSTKRQATFARAGPRDGADASTTSVSDESMQLRRQAASRAGNGRGWRS